ncbi:MAG: fasciclin domain-containing protein [Bacteroides sp.]|nr:fasciclin domain-containing protein [Bacteroides sp.]
MKVHLVSSLFLLFLLSFLMSCTDNNDDYYKRPDWLEPPVYEVLQERGKFTMYLQAVDKTLYSQVVCGSGNYTVFAPNDDAFQKFLNEKGYKSVEDIPVAELNKIIGYSLVYNKFEYSRLCDAIVSNAWVEGTGMRKMTSYYKTIYKEKGQGEEHWVVDIDAKGTNVNIYTPYRGIPVFTGSFMGGNSLGELDYTAFYLHTNYVGANVAAGEIVNRDIYAENGIIHEVSVVPYPLKNLDEMVNGNEKYSKFREFLYYEIAGTHRYVLYEEDVALAEEYKKIYPDSAITTIFKKEFATIPYSLNRENYASNSLRYEQGGYTLIVPSNEAVEKFSKETLYKYTDNIELIPVEIFDYFLKAHMSDMLLWPSHYKMAQNSNGEYLNGEGRNGPDFLEGSIKEAFMASNGIFYYTDDVIKSKYFETVYAEFLINPAFSWLDDAYSTALKTEFMKSKITSQPNVSYTLCLTLNTVLAADGFVHNSGDGSFTHSDGANVSTRMDRIIRQGVFSVPQLSHLNSKKLFLNIMAMALPSINMAI